MWLIILAVLVVLALVVAAVVYREQRKKAPTSWASLRTPWTPDSPAWRPDAPAWRPDAPAWRRANPAWRPDSPAWRRANPAWAPETPAWRRANPAWGPETPAWRPDAPPLRRLTCDETRYAAPRPGKRFFLRSAATVGSLRNPAFGTLLTGPAWLAYNGPPPLAPYQTLAVEAGPASRARGAHSATFYLRGSAGYVARGARGALVAGRKGPAALWAYSGAGVLTDPGQTVQVAAVPCAPGGKSAPPACSEVFSGQAQYAAPVLVPYSASACTSPANVWVFDPR